MTVEEAISKSPDNTASNFGLLGWITVEEQGNSYAVATEANPTPQHYDSLQAVQKAVRLFKSEAWEPYENKFD